MFCENCGKKLNDGAIFCGYCGHKVPVYAPTPAAPVMETPVAPVVETPVVPVVEPVAPVMETPVAPVVEPVAPVMETPVAPVVEPVAPVVETPVVPMVEPVAPVMETPVAPVVEPVAPVMETPVAPVVEPVAPAAPAYTPVGEQPLYQNAYQPQYQPQPQAQPQYQPQAQYQPQYSPQYQPPSYGYDAPAPAKKSNKKLLVGLGVVALIAIAGFLLWYFVLGGNDANELAGTKWLNDDGQYIEFIDEKNAKVGEEDWYGEMQYMDATYRVDGNKLILTPKDAEYTGTESALTYKLSGGKLYLTMYGETIAFENAKNSFTCESCGELSTGKKHTGQMQGYTYAFCDDCWDEVQQYFD